jgi:hypothetical protein
MQVVDQWRLISLSKGQTITTAFVNVAAARRSKGLLAHASSLPPAGFNQIPFWSER